MARLSRLARLANERGGVIGLVVLVAYVALAPVHVVSGDSAELTTLGTIGGVAHPTGYPLYLLFLRATAWLPAATPAHATAIATGVLGAAQVVVLHAACRAWGARPLAATLAVAIYAAAPPVVRANTAAEVFALNGLAAACVLWLAATAGPVRGRARVLVLALVAGLALTDHATAVLVAPVGLLGVARGLRELPRGRLGVAALALAAFALGLSPYLYLLVTRETPTAWTHLDGLGDLVHHALRLDYGGPGTFTSDGAQVAIVDRLAGCLRAIGAAWLWLPALAGIAALGERIARGPRWDFAMLALALLLAGPVLAARMNLAPVGYGAYVCERFYMLPILLLAIPVARALDRLPLVRVGRLEPALAIAVFGGVLALDLPRLARVHSAAVQNLVENTLRGLPPRAIAIVATDSFHYVAGYLQAVLHERPDVDVITWPLVRSAEYRERIAHRTGLAMTAPRGELLGPALVGQALAQGRPVFIDGYQASIAAAFPADPYGVLFHVLPRTATRTPIGEVVETNRALFATYALDYPAPRVDDEPAASVHADYARTWRILADGLAAVGRTDDARAAAALATELAPR